MKCIFLFILLFQFTTIDSYCIPVIFHNLSIYDAHFISKDIVTAYEGYTELLPIIKEKYIYEECNMNLCNSSYSLNARGLRIV